MSIPRNLYKSGEGHARMAAWYEAALQRLPAPFEARTVDTRQGYTHVLVMGSVGAPPIVMIHGLGGCAPMWQPQMAALAADYRLYALDTIGQPGKSAPNFPPYSGTGYGEWLVDVLDALEIERAGVIGLSLGGWLTTRLASRAPKRVASMVLLSSPGFASLRARFFADFAPAVLNLSRVDDNALRRLIYRFLAPPGSGITLKPEVEDAMMLVLRYYNLGGYSVGLRPAFRQIPAAFLDSLRVAFPLPAGELRRLTMPALFLVGQYETLFDPAHALRHARAHLPNLCAAEMIPNAGHGLNYDQADMVNARILAFLREL